MSSPGPHTKFETPVTGSGECRFVLPHTQKHFLQPSNSLDNPKVHKFRAVSDIIKSRFIIDQNVIQGKTKAAPYGPRIVVIPIFGFKTAIVLKTNYQLTGCVVRNKDDVLIGTAVETATFSLYYLYMKIILFEPNRVFLCQRPERDGITHPNAPLAPKPFSKTQTSTSYWSYLAMHPICARNRSAASTVGRNTPCEIWYGMVPNVIRLRVFGTAFNGTVSRIFVGSMVPTYVRCLSSTSTSKENTLSSIRRLAGG